MSPGITSADLKKKRSYLEKRAAIIRAIRSHFDGAGFLEVETPVRVAAPAPELHIDAEPSGDHYLITSPELQMKRLLAAGYERIYQIVHCFRRGERGDKHQPEFTMIEWYRSGAGIADLMADCQDLIRVAATAVGVYPKCTYDRQPIDLAEPFGAISVAEAFEQHAGWTPGANPDPDRFDADLVEKVEPALVGPRPVFLTHYPRAMASLARLDPQNPDTALRFELYAGGLELANGFDELTDPVTQRARFEKEKQHRAAAGKSDYPLDEDFLAALEHGMPQSAGIAFGIDRLVMLLTGASSIDDVVTFPS